MNGFRQPNRPRMADVRRETMVRHRSYGTECKRQAVQEFLSGETFSCFSGRHDISLD